MTHSLPSDKMVARMAGWTHGAADRARTEHRFSIEPEMLAEYRVGYLAGAKARREAQAVAAAQIGVSPER